MSEEKLQELLSVSHPGTWSQYAQQWKQSGKKTVGIIDSYIPEEVLYAAGILPVRIMHIAHKFITQALAYRQIHTDSYYTNVLEAVLKKELPFIDGWIFTNRDDDSRRLYDVFAAVIKPAFLHLMHIPRATTSTAVGRLNQEIGHLCENLEKVWGVKVSDDSLRKTVNVYNKSRELVGKLYEMRKRDVPPLSGAEFLGLTTAALSMPRDVFNQKLEPLMDYLDKRRTSHQHLRPRLLVSSDAMDSREYIGLVEDVGSLVAMDDLDTGSRYFTLLVDTAKPDVREALAFRYLNRPGCPRMMFWDKQMELLIQYVREYRIDGVVELTQRNSFAREFRSNFFVRTLQEAQIPVITLKREYEYANEAQLRTRIGSFVEMLGVSATA
ncbi:MAG: 2-hydroxyacyl-CoA dehydratase [Chloroflexi bacterium]|nr:2-hydroxyacyl-CoA dehydratase [Chloroflexota bacterium]